MRILLIDDDEALMNSLAERLIRQRYAVDIVVDGASAQTYLELFDYDLIVLDLVLPDGDGINFCRQFREGGYTNPLMILTAKESTSQKVKALDAGADDYVIKPFDFNELCARIRALLRREHQGLPTVLQWGALSLNPSTCETSYNQQRVQLTPKELSIMELFLRHPHRIYSLGSIMDDLWSCEDPPGEDAIRTHIKGLRRKLEAAGAPKDLIKTVYGLGYRLNENTVKSPEKSPAFAAKALSHEPLLTQPLPDPSLTAQQPDGKQPAPIELDLVSSSRDEASLAASGSAASGLEKLVEQVAAPWSKSWCAPISSATSSSGILPDWQAYGSKHRMNTGNNPLPGKIAIACKHYLRTASQQVAILEATVRALQDGTLDAKLHHLSQMNAHKLAGSLGSFGLPQGSQIARTIETQLRARAIFAAEVDHGVAHENIANEGIVSEAIVSEGIADAEKAIAILSPLEMAQLVQQLRDSLDQATVQVLAQAVSASVQGSTPLLLIVTEDIELSEQLVRAAALTHLQARVVSTPQQAEAYFYSSEHALPLPDLLLIDWVDERTSAPPFTALIKKIKQDYELPIIVLENQLTLALRLALVKQGVEMVSDRTTSPARLINEAIGVLKASTSQIRVAIADDDPQMLALLKVGLEPWGFAIHTFESALALWQWLTATQPFSARSANAAGAAKTQTLAAAKADVLVLDVEMPEMNGIELCRVLRADARFQSLPILFLTIHQEDTLRMQAFQSGADDFIDKAVAPVELATRLRNQLARACRI